MKKKRPKEEPRMKEPQRVGGKKRRESERKREEEERGKEAAEVRRKRRRVEKSREESVVGKEERAAAASPAKRSLEKEKKELYDAVTSLQILATSKNNLPVKESAPHVPMQQQRGRLRMEERRSGSEGRGLQGRRGDVGRVTER